MQELIQSNIKQLPDKLFEWVDRNNPFVFLDFEVFAKDHLICFSLDGINIKYIVNDIDKLKNLFLTKFNRKILVAYNANGYDKYIMLALLNDIDPKEVNDNIIHNFNFNFNNVYGSKIKIGRDLIWYDPTGRNTGSLKTYEACEGENIYESEVDFDLDRNLTQEEIEETINYCSFDVKMLIRYFHKENFDTFLGHVGLVIQTIEKRKGQTLSKLLPKSDAGLVGMYLCTSPGINKTKSTDCITLPPQIQLGKYKEQIEEFLKIPINTLKTGKYNDLNSWSLNTINKAIAKCDDIETIESIKNKQEKTLNSIKKLKLELLTLNEKVKLTEKQIQKRDVDLPEKIKKNIEKLRELKLEIKIEESNSANLKELKLELDKYEKGTSNYNFILSKIIPLAIQIKDTAKNDSVKQKLKILEKYLQLDNEELKRMRYLVDKKSTIYNSILIEYPFEIVLNIKGIPHLFKTGGIHSVYDKPMIFDKKLEKDKNKILIIADVGSLYPNLMRVFNLCSNGMDDPNEFAQMIFDRIELKKKKDPFAGVLKLILNTTYGCMGSDVNPLYDPANRLKVCIFGQAAIVDLLDKLEDKITSLEIYQSNTDGIVISCDKDEYQLCESVIHDWEHRTGLEMEVDLCEMLIQKDVSNYILVKD